MVSLAYAGGNGARQGIRAGDLVVATSASVGDAMWAKDTLAGVQTAISTRIGQSVRLRLQRRGDRDARPWEVPLNHTYEVELRQPLGLVLRQRGGVDDASQTAGWVEVAEVDPEGTAAESGMVRLGDAVVATSGTLGNSMWEKSSAEGVTAAIGTRFALSDTVRRDWRRDGAEMPRDAPGNRRPHTHPGHTHPGHIPLHRLKVLREGTGREESPNRRPHPSHAQCAGPSTSPTHRSDRPVGYGVVGGRPRRAGCPLTGGAPCISRAGVHCFCCRCCCGACAPSVPRAGVHCCCCSDLGAISARSEPMAPAARSTAAPGQRRSPWARRCKRRCMLSVCRYFAGSVGGAGRWHLMMRR